MDEEIYGSHVILYDKGFLVVGLKDLSADTKESIMRLYDQQKNEWSNIESPLNEVNNECLAWISQAVLSTLTET